MSRLFPDTSPEAEQVLMDLLRKAPAWRKLEMVAELNRTVRMLAMSGLRERYPDATEPELRRHLADLLLGPELAEKAYGPHKRAQSSSRAAEKDGFAPPEILSEAVNATSTAEVLLNLLTRDSNSTAE